LIVLGMGCGFVRGWRRRRAAVSAGRSPAALDYVHGHGGAQYRGCAGLKYASEALPDPAVGLGGSLENQRVAVEIQGPQWLYPDAKDRLLDGGRKLCLDLGPDVLELCAHGSENLLLAGGS